jgi:hypothetical protein
MKTSTLDALSLAIALVLTAAAKLQRSRKHAKQNVLRLHTTRELINMLAPDKQH